MENILVLVLGAIFLISSLSVLVFSTNRRAVLFDRLHFRRRRVSVARTPPRSLSPEKKALEDPQPDYTDAFPPSRRHVLGEIHTNLPKIFGKPQNQLAVSPPNSRVDLQPLNVSTKDLKSPVFTATEFSTEEIKALGDFPDYAALSGVPLPEPYHEFDINKAKPRPYRPFRWSYHQTMSLTKMEPDWWLELENTYAKRIKQRQDLFAKYGKCVLQSLPGSELATKELMEMCLVFLCARYPQYFRLNKEKMVFQNDILHTEHHLKEEDPLEVLVNNVPEDFAIMLRDSETGYYFFRAGVICSALGWNVDTKISLALDQIHKIIPDYKEKMQFSMNRYFSKKPTDKSIQRGSWGLEVDEPLYMPPGDPHEKLRDFQMSDLTIDRCNLRVDWQTLRRLPLSGAIVFNFKALFTPIAELRDEAYVPSLVLKVLKEGKRSIMEYKNTWHTEHVVIPALESYEKEQIEKGVIEKNWQPHTLHESPWFPGWQEKWHRQQGF